MNHYYYYYYYYYFLRRLQSVLNTAVRLVTGASRREHVTSLLRDRHWLPIQQRVDYKLCMMVHRCLSGSAPSYLVDLIMPSAVANARAGLRSAEAKTVSLPRTYSSLGDRAFAVTAPRAWNKLPFVLRNTTSVGSTSRKLKTFFI